MSHRKTKISLMDSTFFSGFHLLGRNFIALNEYLINEKDNMLLILKNEWKYMYFKLILTVPILIIGVYLWFGNFDSMLGIMGGTSIISTIMYFNKEKKIQFNCILPITIVQSAILRIMNVVFLPLLYILVAITIHLLKPEIIETVEVIAMTSIYIVGGLIWFIAEDISDRKGYSRKSGRIIKIIGFFLLIGLLIISHNLMSFLIVYPLFLFGFPVLSIYTFKQRSSYKA